MNAGLELRDHRPSAWKCAPAMLAVLRMARHWSATPRRP